MRAHGAEIVAVAVAAMSPSVSPNVVKSRDNATDRIMSSQVRLRDMVLIIYIDANARSLYFLGKTLEYRALRKIGVGSHLLSL